MYQVRPPSALAMGARLTSARKTFSPAVDRDALANNSDATFVGEAGKMETLLTSNLSLSLGGGDIE